MKTFYYVIKRSIVIISWHELPVVLVLYAVKHGPCNSWREL